MPKKQDAHPNLWAGADLGGFPGAGRKPNAVRRIALGGAAGGIKFAAAVADGRKVVPVVSKATGEVTGFRYPTLDEWKWAQEHCTKVGVPTRSEVTIDRPEMLREMVDAMRAEGVGKDTIAAVVKRLGTEIAYDVGRR